MFFRAVGRGASFGAAFCLCAATPASPQGVAPPLFQSHELIHLTIAADIGGLRDDREEDAEERPARIWIHGDGGVTDSLDLAIRTRGKTRLDRSLCQFPPLRLNFRTAAALGTLFQAQDKLKLVTHCDSRRDVYEQYLLEEYLLYRVLNLLTPHSFLVRLARVTYVDLETRGDSLTRYAFVIEDEDAMAARNGMRLLDDTVEVHQLELDFDAGTLFAVFQYFIANLDWSVSARHNVKVIGGPGKMPVAVPYDFDLAGVIEAGYAELPRSYPIRHVRERLFVSPCKNEHDLAPAFQRMESQREAIYRLFRSQEGLDPDRATDAIEFFEGFYETVRDDRRRRREFIRRCE